MADLRNLRPAIPILLGAAAMLSLSMGVRQSFGLIMQPLTQDIAPSMSPESARNIWGGIPSKNSLVLAWKCTGMIAF